MTHVLRLRVPFADTDASGRIHWASVYRWVEVAEHDLLTRLGITDVTVFPRRAARVGFTAALGAGDEVDIRLGAERVGRTAVTWRWEVVRDGVVCVEGGHTVVHVGADGRPAPLPQVLRTALDTAGAVREG